MKENYSIHNLFWKSLEEYERFDPHLSKLKGLPFIYEPPIMDDIPLATPGIYILTGGRQVGKTTTLKMVIRNQLRQKSATPQNIYYLPCDTISGLKEFLFEIEQFSQDLDKTKPFFLFIDEITYVKDWPRAIKSLADAGFFAHGSVLISGSDTCLLKDAMVAFPGRRGKASRQDFHSFPLSFYEYVALKKPKLASALGGIRQSFMQDFHLDPDILDLPVHSGPLRQLFSDYLLTGGYLPAINDYAIEKTIHAATYNTFSQWIIGDFIKRGKSEQSLREIIRALLLRLSKQVTWHSFVNNLSIEHHQTIADYFELLKRMDVIVILPALRENKLSPAPKKAKKICFCDPFVLHVLAGWANDQNSFYQAKNTLNQASDLRNTLVEGVITSLFNRGRAAYYIKAEGEVDLALIQGRKIVPIEIKNSLVLNKKDLKQIIKYKQGLIGYAGEAIGSFEHLQVLPIPLLAFLAA